MNSEIIANYYIRMTIDKIYKSKTIANSISYTETQFRLFIDKVLLYVKKFPDNLIIGEPTNNIIMERKQRIIRIKNII